MIKVYSTLLCFLYLSLSSIQAQNPVLLPSIGIGALPADSDPVCNIPVYLDPDGNYNAGPKVGDTLPDFTLYQLNGTPVTLSTELATGKPVLLIGGNYTCPVFRNKMNSINTVYNNHNTKLRIYIVYGVEAHPNIDVSPYSGTVWTTSQNQTAGILYRQPTTYGGRKTVVQDMLNAMNIQPKVLIDGPCNNWWSNFGPAPNNAYLIHPKGTVFAKHGWYDKAPLNIQNDISSLLNVLGVEDQPQTEKISIWPNPANNTLWFEKENGHEVNVCITDILGKPSIIPFSASDQRFGTDVSELANGVYIYTVKDKNGFIQTGKFIKQ